MGISNFDNALAMLKKRICRKENLMVSNEVYLNNKRYCLLSFQDSKGNKKRFFCTFKREFYQCFGKDFKDYGEEGLGESINADALDFCLERGVDYALFAYDDGKVYIISPEKIVFRGHERQTHAENKKVVSFSIRYLERFI